MRGVRIGGVGVVPDEGGTPRLSPVIRYSHGPAGSGSSSRGRSNAPTRTRPSRTVTIIPVVPATGDSGAAVDSTIPPPASAARTASQLNRMSRVSGRYAVSESSVDSGCVGSTGQLTVGSEMETGANGRSAAHTTATSAARPARRAVPRPLRGGGLRGTGGVGVVSRPSGRRRVVLPDGAGHVSHSRMLSGAPS